MKIIFTTILVGLFSYIGTAQQYNMPSETAVHEGTWLQWPHQYEYGIAYRNSLDATWIAMTEALVENENVHIIAYNATEQNRITNLLEDANVDMTNIDFKLFQTNDVWVRDNGPIFVYDSSNNLIIEDWGFNGWGGDYNYTLCNPIPSSIGGAINLPTVNLNATLIIEGGSFELDGGGVLLATKSSILAQTNSGGALAIRNPGTTQLEAEEILSQYIGATKFIWLNGFLGQDDVTDAHIDGFAKFANETTLVTMNNSNLQYWGLSNTDISTLYSATNADNLAYNIVYLPLTQNNVVTTNGNNLGYKGSYCNYYIANNVVLVPNYNDANDEVANAIIQELHPDRTVIGIDCRNLYENGGMVHCVTQQQPVAINTNGIEQNSSGQIEVGQNFPNPFSTLSTIKISLEETSNVQLIIYNALGEIEAMPFNNLLYAGEHSLQIDGTALPSGIYTYQLIINRTHTVSKRMIISK